MFIKYLKVFSSKTMLQKNGFTLYGGNQIYKVTTKLRKYFSNPDSAGKKSVILFFKNLLPFFGWPPTFSLNLQSS